MFVFETVYACHYGPAIRNMETVLQQALETVYQEIRLLNINFKNEGIFCSLFDKESVVKYS